jgi:hypothetical protein
VKHDLDPGRGLAADPQAEEPRRDNPGVVQNQHVVGAQELGQIA